MREWGRDRLPEFPANKVPPISAFNLTVHAAMALIIARSDAVEENLVTLHQLDAVASIRNYDSEYAKLTGKLHECNQALYTLFAVYLDRPSAPYTAPIDPPPTWR
jgi:hypothetical protein